MQGDHHSVRIRRVDRGQRQGHEDLRKGRRCVAPSAPAGVCRLVGQGAEGVPEHGWQRSGDGVGELALEIFGLHVGGLEETKEVREHGSLPGPRTGFLQVADEQLERRP